MTLPESLTESIAAFDAANLAWGRHYRYVLRRAADGAAVAAVRAAFGEVAISVPGSALTEEVLAYFDALAAAHQALASLIEDLPEEQRTGDLLVAPVALREAIAALRPWLANTE